MQLIRGRRTVDAVDATLGAMAAIADRTGALVQLVDARYVVDREQVALAVELATAAIAADRQIAEEPQIELLVYLAGTRQIDRALQLSLDPAVETYLAVVSGGGSPRSCSMQWNRCSSPRRCRSSGRGMTSRMRSGGSQPAISGGSSASVWRWSPRWCDPFVSGGNLRGSIFCTDMSAHRILTDSIIDYFDNLVIQIFQ
jgi:hypothetical protein